jgi:putative ABC transport system permease protein
MLLLGLDDATLIGAPRDILMGSLADLRQPNAVIIDEAGYRYMWPGQPYRIGQEFEMNDVRAVIVGICKASPTFQTFPILYSRYSQALQFVPGERKMMSFVLAQNAAGTSVDEVCRSIHDQTGLAALPRDGFRDKTITYYLQRTGIPINFGITVLLGFVVGAAIAGQTFYLFTVENLKQFGALKAMGVSNVRLVGMILLQAIVVGLIGYGIGVGLAALMSVALEALVTTVPPAFYMPWQILAFVGGAVLLIIVLSSLVSIRRVLVLEPAVVFK